RLLGVLRLSVDAKHALEDRTGERVELDRPRAGAFFGRASLDALGDREGLRSGRQTGVLRSHRASSLDLRLPARVRRAPAAIACSDRHGEKENCCILTAESQGRPAN